MSSDKKSTGSLKKEKQSSTIDPTKKITLDLIAKVNRNPMASVLVKLTNFTTRHMQTSEGRRSQLFIVEKATDYLGARMKGTFPARIEEFPVNYEFQRNVTVILPGIENSKKVVIVGAHQDSICEGQAKEAKAPGHDDNGSGVSVILETLRIIAGSGLKFKNALHFVFFRGEEIGLIGSKEIAKKYIEEKCDVVGFLNIDSVSYWPYKKKKIGLVYDNSTHEMIQVVEELIKTFTPLLPVEKNCRYQCGDSAPFKKAGLPCAMVESLDENKYHHTVNDTFKKATNGMDLMEETVKVTLGFMVKLGEVVEQ